MQNQTTTSDQNVLTDQQKNEGWVSLFDGQTKQGWHVFNQKSDGSAWKVADGALYLDTSNKENRQIVGGGDIVTDAEYENFHFQLEWKISKGGNSGIMFYVKEDQKYDAPWRTGPEMQVLDNNGHDDAKIIKHRAGDLYDLISGTPEVVKPVGEWNKVDIISNNGSLEFRLNETSIVKTTMWDDNWKTMVASSKFKDMPDFAAFKSGRIALQDHGDPVWFRNIRVRKL
jgi:hypothetical protein